MTTPVGRYQKRSGGAGCRRFGRLDRRPSDEEKAQIWPGIVAKAESHEGCQVKTSRNIPVVILEPHSV